MVRKLEIKELGKLYRKHIKRDFPPIERAPCFVIKRNMKNNVQEGLIYVNKNEELGYSINSVIGEVVLISLFAVFNGNRGSGIGTKFLEEIIKYYDNKRMIIVEVEKPENAKSYEEKSVCKKRISFYEKQVFEIRKDIEYSIFGLPMYLMVYSKEKFQKEEIINQMKIVYGLILRSRLQNMLKFG